VSAPATTISASGEPVLASGASAADSVPNSVANSPLASAPRADSSGAGGFCEAPGPEAVPELLSVTPQLVDDPPSRPIAFPHTETGSPIADPPVDVVPGSHEAEPLPTALPQATTGAPTLTGPDGVEAPPAPPFVPAPVPLPLEVAPEPVPAGTAQDELDVPSRPTELPHAVTGADAATSSPPLLAAAVDPFDVPVVEDPAPLVVGVPQLAAPLPIAFPHTVTGAAAATPRPPSDSNAPSGPEAPGPLPVELEPPVVALDGPGVAHEELALPSSPTELPQAVIGAAAAASTPGPAASLAPALAVPADELGVEPAALSPRTDTELPVTEMGSPAAAATLSPEALAAAPDVPAGEPEAVSAAGAAALLPSSETELPETWIGATAVTPVPFAVVVAAAPVAGVVAGVTPLPRIDTALPLTSTGAVTDACKPVSVAGLDVSADAMPAPITQKPPISTAA